jgi:hypothetical protein
VVIDRERIEETGGFWFAPDVRGFRFDAVSSITITTLTTTGRKKREYEAWIVTLKTGEKEIIRVGDIWKENRIAIISRLQDAGLEVKDERN